jgi:hypothetical protein
MRLVAEFFTYRRYERSNICYAHLVDVTADLGDHETLIAEFRASEWFLRGWTLQELIAPRHVIFLTADWTTIGAKSPTDNAVLRKEYDCSSKSASLTHGVNGVQGDGSKDVADQDKSDKVHAEDQKSPQVLRNLVESGSGISHSTLPLLGIISEALVDVTGIPLPVLSNALERFASSVATRLSWAAKRKTTRVEDLAYSLLGLFGIQMNLIYGERQRAFTRLQTEIWKRTSDETLLAWPLDYQPDAMVGMVAPNPTFFADVTTLRHAGYMPLADLWFMEDGLDVRNTQPATYPRLCYLHSNQQAFRVHLDCFRMSTDNSGKSQPESYPSYIYLRKLPCGHYERTASYSPDDAWVPLTQEQSLIVHHSNAEVLQCGMQTSQKPEKPTEISAELDLKARVVGESASIRALEDRVSSLEQALTAEPEPLDVSSRCAKPSNSPLR